MAEPTYEELKAKLAEMEKQGGDAAPDRSNFAWAKKEASAYTVSGGFPSRSTTNNGSGCWMRYRNCTSS